jgi:hypothetical protein
MSSRFRLWFGRALQCSGFKRRPLQSVGDIGTTILWKQLIMNKLDESEIEELKVSFNTISNCDNDASNQ